jgi:S1-C subfamily serine protease
MKTEISKRVGTWSMRAMAFGGLTLVDLDDVARKDRGLGMEKMALFVKGMGQFNKHGTAKKVGFLKDDVIVEFAGLAARASEGELIGQVLAKTKIGETVEVTVLRRGERVGLKLPMQ